MTGKVVPFVKPEDQAAELLKQIRALAVSTENIWMHVPHFKSRMQEREVSIRQVLVVIREGTPDGEPRYNTMTKEWSLKLKRYVGGRTVWVVVAVGEGLLTPITVI